MSLRNNLIIFLQRILTPLELRIVKLSTNKVRGIDPLRDLYSLLDHNKEPVVFDVGANDGETIQEFLGIFPEAHVVAFEPDVSCCNAIQRRFNGRPNLRIQNVAVGAKRGTAELNLFSGNRMNSLLSFDEDPENVMLKSFKPTGTMSVSVEALDSFCAEHGIAHIDILKIDTQGYDLEVLKGAATLLEQRRVKTVLLEVNFVPMYQRQATFGELHQFLSALGYRLVDIYNQTRTAGYTAWCDVCYVATQPTALAR